MGELGMMTTIMGTSLSMAGSIYQGNVNANVANYNAQVTDQDATQVNEQGAEDSRRALVNSSKMLSGGQAAYGASGVSGGSTRDVLRAGAAQGELNALTIQYNAGVKANAYSNEANLDRYRATNDQTAGQLGAASALIKGIGQLSNIGGGSGGGDDADVAEALA